MRVVTTIISLLSLPVITAYLDPGSFGIIALFTVESAFLAGLYSLGLGAFAGRMIYKYDRKNKLRCRQYLGVSLFYLVIFSTIGVFISFPFAGILKKLILKDVLFPNAFLLYVPIIYAFFLTVYGFTTNSFLNFQENKKYSICMLIEVLILVPAKIIGLVWFNFSWVNIVMLELISKILVTALSLWIIRDKLGFSFKRLKIISYALRYSLPYVPMTFASEIQHQIDKIFLGRMHAMSSVGIYSMGVKLSDIFRYFSRPVASTIKPEISKRLDSRDANIKRDITDFFNLFFQTSVFLIFAISIFSREIVTLFLERQYLGAFRIIPFVMTGIMLSELNGILQLKLVYKNKTIFFPVIMFFGAFLNVTLNFFLIPRFGIMGAALATVLANLALVFVVFFVSQRIHFSHYNMLGNFAFGIPVLSAVFLIQAFLPHTMTMALLKLAFIAVYGMVLFRYFMRTNARFKELTGMIVNNINNLRKENT